jgi:hypothetical protein
MLWACVGEPIFGLRLVKMPSTMPQRASYVEPRVAWWMHIIKRDMSVLSDEKAQKIMDSKQVLQM